jgi:hypothetical protein
MFGGGQIIDQWSPRYQEIKMSNLCLSGMLKRQSLSTPCKRQKVTNTELVNTVQTSEGNKDRACQHRAKDRR